MNNNKYFTERKRQQCFRKQRIALQNNSNCGENHCNGRRRDSTFNDVFSLGSGNFSEFEWSIRATKNASPNIYYFRAGADIDDELNPPLKADHPNIVTTENGTSFYFPDVNEWATMHYSPKSIPVGNWTFLLIAFLIGGFIFIRNRIF